MSNRRPMINFTNKVMSRKNTFNFVFDFLNYREMAYLHDLMTQLGHFMKLDIILLTVNCNKIIIGTIPTPLYQATLF